MNQFLVSLSGMFEAEGFHPLESAELDFRELDGTCCYCSEEASEVFSKAIPGPEGIAWIDSGDYHYLSYFRAGRILEDFELILLDNHSDDFDLCGLLSCGNWVTALQAQSGCKVSLIRKISDFDPAASALPVFISLDLDVLQDSEFITNWDQGTMTMKELETILGAIAGSRKVLGMDICGGLSVSKGASDATLQSNREFRERLCVFLREISLLP
ncbi:MAG: hypothetical protein ACI3Y4_00240 [Candidatus Cryptobacteroides sp.]